jgi:GNAT superfamily N-acetyltransferase
LSIEYELCDDARLLDQYYRLREESYRRELGIPDFDGSEEPQDREGKIVLAIKNGRCIGGARISPRVTVVNQAGELGLTPDTCCMWERFVLDPTLRTVQMARDFLAHLIEASRDAGYNHALVLSSRINARFYRQCHSALGVGFQIHKAVPDYAKGAFAGLEHYLSIAELRDAQPIVMAA